ncbi:oxalyl-CoA decarboxylase [Paraburkholderia sp. Ac-20347]|uniref:oxalyl-CoA decarboxylase n=1 Tax=Paraburkholderia sp. Ac-20347 TaxID=2703892 RepID=UPI00197FF6B3|nr:oxalyl-CoA decarboxylase [Paraburkholderia sp. Ac-20347]MBN3809898.1 oxalyl-CoA decarboxylase [Paraburkholderia sp. Ac-20347]
MADSPAQAALTDGFHLAVEALKLNRIDTIYGVAGIPITDLARLAQAEGIRYLGFRHEQSAGNAAAISGYLNQWPGVCLTVSAPGFLNGLVALANATTNGFPMIQISGSSDRAIIDLQQGDYEELDQMNAAKPFAKAAFRINRPEDIGIGVARAIRAAVSGRPGGVYLDLTAAALAATTDAASAHASLIKVVDPAPARIPSQESVTRALSLLASAQRPLVILGKGAAYAQADDAIRAFLEETGIPFLPMSMAKGLLPDNHAQSAAAARSFVLGQADVVMLLGARLNWLLGHGKAPQWSANARLIQVEIEPAEFDSNRAIAAPVAGDIASAMAAFLQALSTTPVRTPDAWTEAIIQRRKHNEEKMAANLQANPDPMTFQSGLRAVRDVLANNPDVYLVNEGANTLDFGRNIIDMQMPRRRLDAGTWGVMGIGMGYSIGAAVTSGRPVVAIEGDSAFGFSGMEIETICRYRLPVVIVVFNNGGIYHGDDINRSGGADPGPTVLMGSARYDRLIEAFGGKGYHVTRPEELTAALTTALAAKAPTLINCVIDPHAGTESGHLKNLNPKSGLAATK